MFNNMSNDELLNAYETLDRETKEVSLAVFCAYNCRDVEVIEKLDIKFRFIKMVAQMARENTVQFNAMLGTVKYVQTGIVNYAHKVHKLVVPDKNPNPPKNKKVEGAIVLTPRMGLHKWIGSVDLTSLYPSIMRALGMSLETFVGQFQVDDDYTTYGENAWFAIWKKHDTPWTAVIDGEDYTMTGAEWHAFIREQNWSISAVGTLFDQKKPGMIASVLTHWFSERKRLQSEKRRCSKLADTLRTDTGIMVGAELAAKLRPKK